jgi:DNA-3-methyladenine glycosylase
MTDQPMHKLPPSFYQRDPVQVAQELLGSHLVHLVEGAERIGRIVEVEAYLGPHDLAAHASKGLTPRTRVLFGPPGHAYVYLVYGLHFCLNVVTGREGEGSAVLLRALEPVRNLSQRAAGPGLLCRAMQIDLSLNGHDLASDDLYIAAGSGEPGEEIVARPRIGVDYSGIWAEQPLRFYLKGNPFISRA